MICWLAYQHFFVYMLHNKVNRAEYIQRVQPVGDSYTCLTPLTKAIFIPYGLNHTLILPVSMTILAPCAVLYPIKRQNWAQHMFFRQQIYPVTSPDQVKYDFKKVMLLYQRQRSRNCSVSLVGIEIALQVIQIQILEV